MRRLPRLPISLACLLALAACVAPKEVAAPPPPIPVPVAAPPVPKTTDWRDVPLTPGDWRYDPAGPAARFGPPDAPVFVVRCDRAARTVSLARVADGAAPATMAITTSGGDRALAAAPTGPPGALVATLPANDGFLDRMAFSRGRFVVAVTGTPRLMIPAWPEFARAIEDCRG